jgi:hypothetical protein
MGARYLLTSHELDDVLLNRICAFGKSCGILAFSSHFESVTLLEYQHLPAWHKGFLLFTVAVFT